MIEGVLGVLAPDASASTRLQCLAYTNVPLSTYVKFDTYPNLRWHCTVLPVDSTAFLSEVIYGMTPVLELWEWTQLRNYGTIQISTRSL